jgi:hypothetical protein
MRGFDLVTEETKTLVSYVKERYDSEPEEVQATIKSFAIIIDKLVNARNKLER